MFENLLFQVPFLLFVGLLAQWIAWRFRLPGIVIMSMAGLLIGPFTGLVSPKETFGPIFHTLISLAVAVILFEGSLSLDFREIREFRKAIKRIATIGAGIAWIAGSMAAHYVAGLSWPVAFVIGGLFIVTGPTVILPLLRQAKLKERPAAILKWEGIVVDPFGALLALFAYQVVLNIYQLEGSTSILIFFVSALLAALLGGIVGFLMGQCLERGIIPEFLKSPLLLVTVLLVFAISDAIMHETGLLAVTVMGLVMANMHLTSHHELLHFKENISVILISSVFIMLTASLTTDTLAQILDWRMFLFGLTMMFIVRPLSIWGATINAGLSKKERLLIGWIAPRGIVALTVSGYFATALQEAGFPSAQLLTALTLALVFTTVVAHGFSISWLAKKLDLQASSGTGVVIVGASSFTTQLATSLQHNNVEVLLMDSSWQQLSMARQQGIKTEVGDILSEHTEFYVDLTPYNQLIAATTQDAYNVLVCAEFLPILGRFNIYQTALHSADPENYSRKYGGQRLVASNYDIQQLNERIEQGASLRQTKITDVYTIEQYKLQNPQAVMVYAIRPNGEIIFDMMNKYKQIQQEPHSVISLL
ncbi:cation:proton antiporter [Lysinibacillus piscis]|uniref:Sodium/hydrogen exchanger n=1 Tax=Lysinibacillus piscis TaxID=2518931 RepID=A0ABQ5NL62_9BACI|nr:sodium:proton antiporter [Lysinibacillus sp. KH24]GLC88836.1 sodium/hydrogen exchanger [Lysinibacillus sp. KH24]